MNQFTVLVLRPDYVSDNQGQDLYHAWVDAPNVRAAQQVAKREAVIADTAPDERKKLPESYIVQEMGNYMAIFVCKDFVRNMAEEG